MASLFPSRSVFALTSHQLYKMTFGKPKKKKKNQGKFKARKEVEFAFEKRKKLLLNCFLETRAC